MRKVITLYISLFTTAILVLASCTTQMALNGLWQGTTEIGSIEFKATGEVIIVDNMSATVIGTYEVEDGDSIKFELIASDILRDSVQPSPKTVVTAKIIKLNGDELQLRFNGETGVANYLHVR